MAGCWSESASRLCISSFKTGIFFRNAIQMKRTIISFLTKYSHFDTPTGGWVAGSAKRDIKAHSAELKLELGLDLAIIFLIENSTDYKIVLS